MVSDSLWTTFAELGQRVPEVEAILSPGRQSLRFRDLPSRIQSVREELGRLGIGRGVRVASLLRRSPETAVCYLGVTACATYVPLNPDFTEAEITRYLTQLCPAALILPEGHGHVARGCASALRIRVIELVSRVSDPAGTFSLQSVGSVESPQSVCGWNTEEDIALVLLTSGSTAEPKAVPLRVRHLLTYARAAGLHFRLTADDRCLHVMPMFHGHGLKSSLLVPLANGSGVIISPDFDVPTFFEQLGAMRPTWYSAVASIHQAILARVDDYGDVARGTRLRFIRAGSSRLDPALAADLERAFGAPVVELYSMSETGNLTANPLPPAVRKPGSVGRPMGNEVAIVDHEGSFLGPHREGEVVARGPSVFDGYLDHPAANQAAFIDGWFRTGDLGHFDDEGYLTLTGRIKDVIVRGGEKISAAEVEGVMLRHPGVSEACAFGLPHPSLGEEVAVAVSASGLVSELELVAFAREFLVSVKAPKRIFVLKTLPKGPANKVRRFEVAAHCQALAGARRRSTRETRASWTPLEQDIARIWKELLRIDVVEPDDDFFLLGGDSLKAAEFLARLHRRYRVSLGLGAMFEDEATVSGMARVVERARSDTSHASMAAKNLVPIKASGTRTPLFVVPAKAGTPIGFVHLARLLDAQQPVIGIEFRGMNGLDRPLARMEDIAADNVARIRMIQPQGPYLLMGNCFGGCVTYEMARQLEAAGEIVRLFMLDAPSPFSDGEGRRRGSPVRGTPGWKLLTQYALGRMRKHVTSLMELQGSERTAFLREKMAATLAIVRTRDVFRGDRRRFGRRAVYAANRQASRNYVPGPFAGPVVLYLTRDRETESQRSRRLDWLSLAPQIGAPSYIGGRGSGRSMLTPPYVYELASAVNRELEAARADAGSRGPKRAPLVRVEKAPFVREPTRRPS